MNNNLLCSKCRQRKPPKEFHRNASNKRGRNYVCKLCLHLKGRTHPKWNAPAGTKWCHRGQHYVKDKDFGNQQYCRQCWASYFREFRQKLKSL